MPKVEDTFSQQNSTKYFSTLDLRAGYYHIPLDEESIPKTAFTSPFGKYEYIKVPGILKDFNFAIAHLDDIITISKTAEEHLDHIRQVFTKLRSAYLSMKLSKCHFSMKEIHYLGHILSTKGDKATPLKTQVIQNMHPQNAKTSTCISWTCRLLQKIHKEFCKNSKTSDIINMSTSQV